VEVLQQEQGENLMFRRILLKPETKAAKNLNKERECSKLNAKFRISVVILSSMVEVQKI
jgi:hypothetical protein